VEVQNDFPATYSVEIKIKGLPEDEKGYAYFLNEIEAFILSKGLGIDIGVGEEEEYF